MEKLGRLAAVAGLLLLVVCCLVCFCHPVARIQGEKPITVGVTIQAASGHPVHGAVVQVWKRDPREGEPNELPSIDEVQPWYTDKVGLAAIRLTVPFVGQHGLLTNEEVAYFNEFWLGVSADGFSDRIVRFPNPARILIDGEVNATIKMARTDGR